MKEIPLTQGKVALVDDEDYSLVMQYKWHANRNYNTFYAAHNIYLRPNVRERRLVMHRLIMNPPGHMQIDHINHNGLDNRKENLRVVTIRENSMNRVDKSSTGYTGVVRYGTRFNAHIRINGVYKSLGYFNTSQDASAAYLHAANQLIQKAKVL